MGARDEPAADVLDSEDAGSLVVRGGLIRAAGFAAGILLSLVGVVFVTRELGPARYGQFQTILSLLVVVQSFTEIGMATLGLREYAQRRGEDRRRFMGVLLGLRLALTSVGVLLAVTIAATAGYSDALVVGTLLGGFGLLLTVVQTTLAIPLGVELRLSAVTAIDFTRQALTAAFYVAVVLAGGGVLPLLAVAIPVQVALLLWTGALVRGRVPLRPAFDLVAWRALLTTSVAFALAMAVGTIYQYTAQLLTAVAGTDEQTGLFAASFRTFIVIAAVPALLVTTAFPLLSRAARDDRVRLAYGLRKLTDAMVIAGVGVSLGVVFAAGPIIHVIGGEEFEDATGVLRVHGLALLLTFAVTTWGFGLLSLHRHRPMIVANLASFVVTAVLVLVLVGPYGAQGTVWGTVAGEAVLAVGYLSALVRAGIRVSVRVPLTALALGLAVGGADARRDGGGPRGLRGTGRALRARPARAARPVPGPARQAAARLDLMAPQCLARGRPRARRYDSCVSAAVRAQENVAARVRPASCRRAASAGSPRTRCRADLIDSTSSGSKCSAASPATSASDARPLVATGTPRSIASRTGRPKPS